MPTVREADLPTWRVPKMSLHPTKPRARIRLWLPIAGLAALVLVALCAGLGGEMRADAASISARPLGETSDNRVHIVANVEKPPAIEPAVHHVRIAFEKPKSLSARKRHVSKRPLLAVDVATPLGDLARRRPRS